MAEVLEHHLYSLIYHEKKQPNMLQIYESEIETTNSYICDVRIFNKDNSIFKDVKALIDTGATFSAFNSSIAKDLKLQACGFFSYSTPDLQKMLKSRYEFNLQIKGIDTYIEGTGAELPYEQKNFDFVIGMDIIKMGKLVIDEGNLTFEIY